MRSDIWKLAVVAALTGLAHPSMAANITGLGAPNTDPALTGATVVDFESASTSGHFTSLTIGDLTISSDPNRQLAISAMPGTAQQQNMTEQYLYNFGTTPALYFDFAHPVSAFAFNFGGGQSAGWTLQAFSGTTLLASRIVNSPNNSNAGEFFGLTGADITHVKFSFSGSVSVIGIDNFTYLEEAPVGGAPEPLTWTMMIAGFGLIGAALRGRRPRIKAASAN